MNFLFKKEIKDWNTWGKVYTSVNEFKPLINEIFRIENIKYNTIENCTPGTNAVFKCDSMIIKIFAPKESGMNTDSDYKTELFGIKRAIMLGVSTPKLIAAGSINDKYIFRYIITEFINGQSFSDKFDQSLADQQKINLGKKLREVTDKLNTKTEDFNSIDIIDRALHCKRWNAFNSSFNKERIEFLSNFTTKNAVYVHGDINPDNILITDNEEIYLIDFADAMIAPKEYELVVIICELFCFDKSYIKGYLGENFCIDELTEQCLEGLMIHNFGSNIIIDNLGDISTLNSLEDLKKRIYDKLSE